MSGYFRAKAELLLKKSPEIYRKEDFFRHPPAKMTKEERKGILFAAEQIANGLGFSEENPVQEVGLNHLIMLAHCFHFKELKVNSQQLPGRPFILDKIRIKHVITEEEEILYLHTTADMPRSVRKRRLPIFQKIGPDYMPRIGYHPKLQDSDVIEKGMMGEYNYEVHTNCVATGSIQYLHLLICYAPKQESPCLVVSAEVLVGDDSELVFGLFHFKGHSNLGTSRQIRTMDDFLREAKPLALEKLSVI